MDDPYEPPANPELTISAEKLSPQEAAVVVIEYLESKGIVRGL